MKQFRLLLKTVVFAALALSMSLQANISPLAFNGIFKCFKPGYEMYAPNLETIDLTYTNQLEKIKLSGTFQNLRTIDISKSAITEIIIRPGSCPNLQSTDPRIRIIELKRNSPDGERDDEPDAKKQCVNDIREN